MEDSPIFAKTYDLLRWLLPHTGRFPRSQRFVLARQIEEAAFGFHRAILRARGDAGARETFAEADCYLAALRLYLRLATGTTTRRTTGTTTWASGVVPGLPRSAASLAAASGAPGHRDTA